MNEFHFSGYMRIGIVSIIGISTP